MTTSPLLTAHLPLDRNSNVPLHRQIHDGFRRAIVDGWLRPGQRVPSTRVLAAELAVSRFPVVTAYEQLLHEGYLEGRVGAGTFVCGELPGAVRPAAARDEGGLRPFRMSLPALDHFPHARWARLVARHAHGLEPAQMAYGDPAGLEPLRSAVAEHLRTTRAVRCEPDQVVIVSGSQAALRIFAAIALAPGDAVAIEEPGYPGARAALATSGAELVPVPVDGEGMDVAALERLAANVRAAYVTPAHQYPLGVSMPPARRRALLDWAARREAWVLEDDYDSEYRYASRPLGALQGTDKCGRVVYVGTFSKVLFPSIRIGYLVVPPTLRPAAVDAREALDLFSPPLYQLALADFLREGDLARHVRRMRKVYLARRQALLDGLAAHCAGRLTVLNADAGLHVATLLPDGVDDRAVVERLARRSLVATPLSACHGGPASRGGLLLGFGGFTESRLADATRALGEVLRDSCSLHGVFRAAT
jgi:GntR family transcriptional regulator/MocR family aminotransferase